MTCRAMLPATPGAAQKLVQVIVSSNQLAIALHGAAPEMGPIEPQDQAHFLQNVATAALSAPRGSDEAQLTLIERVHFVFSIVLRLIIFVLQWPKISRIRLLELKGQVGKFFLLC